MKQSSVFGHIIAWRPQHWAIPDKLRGWLLKGVRNCYWIPQKSDPSKGQSRICAQHFSALLSHKEISRSQSQFSIFCCLTSCQIYPHFNGVCFMCTQQFHCILKNILCSFCCQWVLHTVTRELHPHWCTANPPLKVLLVMSFVFFFTIFHDSLSQGPQIALQTWRTLYVNCRKQMLAYLYFGKLFHSLNILQKSTRN